jgi:hypothetical protein
MYLCTSQKLNYRQELPGDRLQDLLAEDARGRGDDVAELTHEQFHEIRIDR